MTLKACRLSRSPDRVFVLDACLLPRQEIARGSKGDFLFPTTGEALTVTPSDKADVSCSLVDWNGAPTTPTLTVLTSTTPLKQPSGSG